MISDITIIIKTFNRQKALERLLLSIEKFYKNLPIVIVDDSKKNYKSVILKKFKYLNINYIVENFDIGLSKGRNILVNNVKTKYFLLCDDDFEFDDRTDILKFLSIIEKNNFDILGGNVYNRFFIDSLYSLLWTLKDFRRIKSVLRKEEFISIYNGEYTIDNKKIYLKINNDADYYKKGNIYNTDICSNFFIANTKKIKEIGGWTPELLKVGEHEFFFLKAKKANLKIAYTPDFGVVHYPKKSMNYIKYRGRAQELFNKACEIQQLDEFIVDIFGKFKYFYKKN